MPIRKSHLFWSIILLATGYLLFTYHTESPQHSGDRETIAEQAEQKAEEKPAVQPDAGADILPQVTPESENPMAILEKLFGVDDPAWAWAQVDLQAVETALPDNLYWEMSAPTKDIFLLNKRAETREYWNKIYGKVLSNTGTEAEVRDYYRWRNRVSSDHIEFTTHMIENYGQVLPERDLRLLELARTLHLARLEQLPRDLALALERRDAHQKVRDAWLAGEAEFQDMSSQ